MHPHAGHHVDPKEPGTGRAGKLTMRPKSRGAVSTALPKWFHIAQDEKRIWGGGYNHARYQTYVHDMGAPLGAAWCSIFVNWLMSRCGYSGTRGNSDQWLAASWMKWGRKLDQPRPGAIVVVDDGDAGNPYLHVAIVEKWGPSGGYLLGGNQAGGRVCSVHFGPGYKYHFRWPDR